MKLNRILILTLTLGAAFVLPSTTFAGKGSKAAKGEAKTAKAARPGKALKGLDANSNKQIDGDEIEALKKQFAAEPTGPLARLDRNKDGTLNDKEIRGSTPAWPSAARAKIGRAHV